uniref:Ig-like domain-containing protein n=1 Tax=Poecilia mexicana TaxID=48701 RepID=A0A3B3XJU0_9TELE
MIAICFSLVSLVVFQTIRVSRQIAQIGASLGDTVTLTCNFTGHKNVSIYWYKVNYGDIIQRVASTGLHRVTLEGEFHSPRHSIIRTGHVYYLTIRNVRKEDEASYMCEAITANKPPFINVTHLAVTGHKNQKSVYVKQISETTSVPLGTEITLECSLTLLEKNKAADRCAAEHSVFWFKAGSQSDPGMMFAARNICDSEPGRSCSYRLSKTIQNPSDAGIYHCAVVTCGGILFGEGTKVELGKPLEPLLIVLSLLLGLCVIVIAILIFSRD